jgi:hypothetical protein
MLNVTYAEYHLKAIYAEFHDAEFYSFISDYSTGVEQQLHLSSHSYGC